MNLLLAQFPGFLSRRRNINKSTTRPATMYADPKVDNNEPPTENPDGLQYGSYCFRARAHLVSVQEPSNQLTEFTGLSEQMDIVDKVSHYCERTRNDDTNKRCTPTSLAFTGPLETCDGRVVVHDKINDISHVYF